MSSKVRRGKREKSPKSDDDLEEKRRREDIKARDEFAERLKSKDSSKQRNIALKNEQKSKEEAAKRLRVEQEGRRDIVERLRIESRRKYLGKRKKTNSSCWKETSETKNDFSTMSN